MTATETVWTIADEYVAALAEHEPAAAQAGGHPSIRPLPDLSPEWLEEKYALQGRMLERLARTDAADDAVLRAALMERLTSDRALFDTGFTMRLIAGLACPVHLVLYSIDGLTITADAAGESVIERLEAAPEAIDQYVRALGRARELGREGRFSGSGVAAVRQIDILAGQVEGWVANDFFGNLPRASDLPAPLAQRADLAGRATTESLKRLISFLRDDLRADAPIDDAMGPEVYPSMVTSMLGSDPGLDLDEVYAYGWSELERLVAESRSLAEQLGGRGDDPVRDAAARLDERYGLNGVPAIRDWLTQRVAETIEVLGQSAFELPASITDVECVVSEASTGVVYYTPGPPDGAVPSRIVWTIPSGVPVAATWQEVTSVHHEGLPGHHLEHTVNRANPDLHPWQRYLCEIHGYAEGWAHYAEGLSDELSLIRDPAERLGMVLGQIWRSVRIVADIGMHTGRPVPPNALVSATAWTPELARDMLVDFALVEPSLAGFEVDRYFGWPGQALAFKVGAKLWLEARSQWKDARGDDFALAAFHREALAFGPMGLGPLREQLLSR